jgi:hypothetical protein
MSIANKMSRFHMTTETESSLRNWRLLIPRNTITYKWRLQTPPRFWPCSACARRHQAAPSVPITLYRASFTATFHWDLVPTLRPHPSRSITCCVHPGTSQVSMDCNNRRDNEVNQYSFQPYTLHTSLHCTAPCNEINGLNVCKTPDRKWHQRISLLISTAYKSLPQELVLKTSITTSIYGRVFKSRWGNYFSNWPNLSGRTMGLELTQPLTEMSTINLPARKSL